MKHVWVLLLVGLLIGGTLGLVGLADGPTDRKSITFGFLESIYTNKQDKIRSALVELWWGSTNVMTESMRVWADSGWLNDQPQYDIRSIANTNKIVKMYRVMQEDIHKDVDAATIVKWKNWFDNEPGAEVVAGYYTIAEVMEQWAVTNMASPPIP